jgi:hypothetical protein
MDSLPTESQNEPLRRQRFIKISGGVYGCRFGSLIIIIHGSLHPERGGLRWGDRLSAALGFQVKVAKKEGMGEMSHTRKVIKPQHYEHPDKQTNRKVVQKLNFTSK